MFKSKNNLKPVNYLLLNQEELILKEQKIKEIAEENQKLNSNDLKQQKIILEQKEIILQLRKTTDLLLEKNKKENLKNQEIILDKLDLIKQKKKVVENEMERKDKFLNQVKISYKKNENEIQTAEILMNEAKEFFIDNSVFLSYLSKELVNLKNPTLIQKLRHFKKVYDKIQINLQKYCFSKGTKVFSEKGAQIKSRKSSVDNSKNNMGIRNRSFCSVSSVASHKIGINTSRISVFSVKSKNSLNKSQKEIFSTTNSKTPKKNNLKTHLNEINHEKKLQNELEVLKANYKKCIQNSGMDATNDLLVREKLNFCAAEIQNKTKLLMQIRKNKP